MKPSIKPKEDRRVEDGAGEPTQDSLGEDLNATLSLPNWLRASPDN